MSNIPSLAFPESALGAFSLPFPPTCLDLGGNSGLGLKDRSELPAILAGDSTGCWEMGVPLKMCSGKIHVIEGLALSGSLGEGWRVASEGEEGEGSTSTWSLHWCRRSSVATCHPLGASLPRDTDLSN